MSYINLAYKRNTIGRISVNPLYVSGIGNPLSPILDIQLDLTLNSPLKSDNTPIYSAISLLQIGGSLLLQSLESIAFFISEPLCREFTKAISGDNSTQHIQIALDAFRIKRLEKYRKQVDMELKISFWGLLVVDGNIGKIDCNPLDIKIPQSQWTKNVLERWQYSKIKLIELRIPEGSEGELFNNAYAYVEKAVDHFNKGNDKEVLSTLYLAFESIAKSIGCSDPDQNAFVKLLEGIENAKKEKLKLMLDYYCRFLHLGRHESTPPVSIEHKDSEFVLIIAQVIFSYLSNLLTSAE